MLTCSSVLTPQHVSQLPGGLVLDSVLRISQSGGLSLS